MYRTRLGEELLLGEIILGYLGGGGGGGGGGVFSGIQDFLLCLFTRNLLQLRSPVSHVFCCDCVVTDCTSDIFGCPYLCS